jgi:uncharacterized membrane protein
MTDSSVQPTTRRFVIGGFVLGVGLGGLFDGIVLHQLLQWHHLVSNLYPVTSVETLELNTWWDGVFHSAMYVLVVIGLFIVLWAFYKADFRLAPRPLFGAILIGAGTFNIFDSIVNHWILQIHHIRSGPDEAVYDIAFFLIGDGVAVIGLILLRSTPRHA